ncbi:hypothetical protein BaOVIS_001680 [Babesia ovis]|uniref:Uncharacterized protein n=1 Tax=Babesia ovis TaxID=5869 RepID=A0A9W5TBN8_BABOV|nr:hypothetical protein BaOVIS_001680 [Babesia ovis]
MASRLTWVARLERCLPRRRGYHSTGKAPESPVSNSDGRYDPQKMKKLFQNVTRTDEMDVVTAEISGLTSSIVGTCWHRGALGGYISSDQREGSSNTHDRSGSDSHANEVRDELLKEMQQLMQNDRLQRERIRQMLAKEHKLKIDANVHHNKKVSTMTLLGIASDISSRKPAHEKPQQDTRRNREHGYYRNLQRLEKGGPRPDAESFYKHKPTEGNELVRVLDVDQLPLPLLHHMVCYTLVKHTPAEVVLNVISRIAALRDNVNHVAYQNFLRDVGAVISPICRAEVVALLSRSYESISVPFMVDYVRRFGTFSRRFMAKLIQRQANPQALDFLRYRAHQRGPNQLITRPWALFGYVKMLKKSSAKSYMYHNLVARGYVPDEYAFDRFHAFGTLDANMANTILNSERLLNDTVVFDNEQTKIDELRPKIYSQVLEAQALGIPLEDVQEEIVHSDSNAPSKTSTQLVKVQRQIEQNHKSANTTGFHDLDERLPQDRSYISWSTPWGSRRNAFYFKGKSYVLDPQGGWKTIASPVRIHYLKNVQMNKRKRLRKAMRRKAARRAIDMLTKST